MSNLFVRAWKGEASLAAAFWLIYFLFGIILAIIVAIIFKVSIHDYQYQNYSRLIAAICFPYTLYSIVCVWRCAKNSNAFWRIVARILMVLALLFGIVNIWSVIRNPVMPIEEITTTTTTTTTEEPATTQTEQTTTTTP